MKSIYIAAIAAIFSLNASAKIIAEADVPDGSGAVIAFHDTKGPCEGSALWVQYVPKDGGAISGCYVPRGIHLACVFFDGDTGLVPMEALRDPKRA